MTESFENLDKEFNLIFNLFNSNFGSIPKVLALIFEDLHVFELVIFLQLI